MTVLSTSHFDWRAIVIEIKIKRYAKLQDNWQFVIYNHGKPAAFSRNYYSRKRDCIRGAERLAVAMFRGVRITVKSK